MNIPVDPGRVCDAGGMERSVECSIIATLGPVRREI
jgi:hypothetical protein